MALLPGDSDFREKAHRTEKSLKTDLSRERALCHYLCHGTRWVIVSGEFPYPLGFRLLGAQFCMGHGPMIPESLTRWVIGLAWAIDPLGHGFAGAGRPGQIGAGFLAEGVGEGRRPKGPAP